MRSRRALAACVATVIALTVAGASSQPAPQQAGQAQLAKLDAILASGDVAAVDRLLQALGPDVAASERLAFDVIYVLAGRGAFDMARLQWNRLAPRLLEARQRAVQAGTADSGAERRRVAESMFAQALLTPRDERPREAIELLQQADGLGFPPLDSPLMRLAAECLLDLREFDLAAGAYTEYLKKQPADTGARAGLGAALYSTGKVREARQELEQVLAVAPATPRANYTLAAALFELKLYAEARTHLQRELALDARCTPCLARLAHVAYLEGDDAQCRSWLDKASAIDPDDVETRLVSGMLALRGGQYDAAIDHLSRLIARSPEFPTARYQIAQAYLRAGQPDKAREHLDAYKRLLDAQKARELGVRGAR